MYLNLSKRPIYKKSDKEIETGIEREGVDDV